MARVAINVIDCPGPRGTGTTRVDDDFTASDPTNDHSWTPAIGDILYVENTSGGALSVTVNTSADSLGRDTDPATSVEAGAVYIWGPFDQLTGWVQSDGDIYVDVAGSASDFNLLVLRKP